MTREGGCREARSDQHTHGKGGGERVEREKAQGRVRDMGGREICESHENLCHENNKHDSVALAVR